MTDNSNLITEKGAVTYNSKEGAEIYRRSLTMLLECVVSELYPGCDLRIGQTIMQGYYYETPPSIKVNTAFIETVSERMHYLVNLAERFSLVTLKKEDAIALYRKKGRLDKVKTLTCLDRKRIDLVFLRKYFDFVLGQCVTHTGFLRTFRLIKYNDRGFILQFPAFGNIHLLPPVLGRQTKLFKVYLETRNWNSILGIDNVGDLNEFVLNGSISTIIKVQEAFQEKKIGIIADGIKRLFPKKRVILVSGPSSSGKTTFIKRLGIQIRANGLVPEEVSLDNYFVPRLKTPKTPDGDFDFECLEALDLPLLSTQLSGVLSGSEITLPAYDFKTGRRKNGSRKILLKDNSVLLVEGIHALNPALCPAVDEDKRFKIFVSALTQLSIDNDNRIFTSDARLLRRIVRDNLFRGYSAEQTISRFPKVRHGEDRHIFPFQDEADVFFNSSIIYEQGVIKPFVSGLLNKVKKESCSYHETRRLLNYLNFFLPISPKEVPQTSILREFIGKSGFNY